MNIEVTSVSHKEQRAGDVAAAVYVITQEDIRRSGMTTVPELLRLVPGVQVAQINSNKWAVAVRGFNNLFADKLLVLVDGRTVYDRLNSGLFWESLDIPLDQIERIEVVRGPGRRHVGRQRRQRRDQHRHEIGGRPAGRRGQRGRAARSTARTSAARYGGTLGGVAYRVYSQWSGHGESLIDATTPANDSWQSQTHGFRLDWTGGRNAFMAEGGATLGKAARIVASPAGPVPAVKPAWNDVVVHAGVQRPRPLDAPPRQRRVAPGAVLRRLSATTTMGPTPHRLRPTSMRSITPRSAAGTIWSSAPAIDSSTNDVDGSVHLLDHARVRSRKPSSTSSRRTRSRWGGGSI